jgi:hypothetical protein
MGSCSLAPTRLIIDGHADPGRASRQARYRARCRVFRSCWARAGCPRSSIPHCAPTGPARRFGASPAPPLPHLLFHPSSHHPGIEILRELIIPVEILCRIIFPLRDDLFSVRIRSRSFRGFRFQKIQVFSKKCRCSKYINIFPQYLTCKFGLFCCLIIYFLNISPANSSFAAACRPGRSATDKCSTSLQLMDFPLHTHKLTSYYQSSEIILLF